MPMVQSPGLGDSIVYRTGVFNGCLASGRDSADRSRSRYGDKSRLRICGRGARWIPSIEIGLVSMGGAEASGRLLPTPSQHRYSFLPDHLDPRRGPLAL